MRTVEGKVAAITGAGSGIGRALAVLLARRKAHLALSDVDGAGLEQTAALARAEGPGKVTARVVDVSVRDEVLRWADAAAAEHGAVHVVINNAGVALGATLEDTDDEDLKWVMGINFWGVVHGTRAFLPHLRAAGEGHLVNVSSVFGLIGMPTQGAYVASKFAVKGYTETLRQELDVEGANIGVTVVHPGGIKTNIARAARLRERPGWVDARTLADDEKLFITSADQAARQILAAILANRRRQLIGRDAWAIDLIQRLFPSLYQRLLIAAVRRRQRSLLARRGADGKG